MTAAPPPTRIPLATYDLDDAIGWDEDAIEVDRHFGRRHSPEPVQPLVRIRFERGDRAEWDEYWLSRGEAQALAHALVVACIPPSRETKA